MLNKDLFYETYKFRINGLIDEYKKVGIKKEEIKLQLAPGRHYNDTSSNVIAKCLFKELNT